MSYQANKWTSDELDTVSEMFKNGKSYDEIHKSKKVSRSAYAIECKLVNMINDELSSGKSHKEVAKLFNRNKDEIKEMEAKSFEIRNKSAVNTQYTNDGGYEYKKNKSPEELLDLSEFQHINRVVGTVVNFYENISRIHKLHKDNIIDEDFYNQLLQKLQDFKFDKDKILQSVDMTNYSNTKQEKQKKDKDDKSQDTQDTQKTQEDTQKTQEETKTLTKKKYVKRIC